MIAYIRCFVFAGVINEVVLEARLDPTTGPKYVRDTAFINGLPSYKLDMREHIKVSESQVFKVHTKSTEEVPSEQFLEFVNFPPGSLVAFQ